MEDFATFPFGRALPFVEGSVRGALGAEPRRSSSAFRLDATGASFVAVDDDDGFSPVIDASKSPICERVSEPFGGQAQLDQRQLTGMVAVVPVE